MDTNLEPLICKSIPEGIDLPSSQLPCRLDKPVYLALSKSYADILKKQFSLVLTVMTSTADNNCLPRKKQAAIIDYNSDTSTDVTTSTTVRNNTISNQSHSTNNTESKTNNEYAMELALIKTELTELRTMITNAVEQFKTAIATLATTTQSPLSSAMDTEVDTLMQFNNTTQNTTDLAEVIQDLKYEIVTIITETQAMFEQQLFHALTNKSYPSSVT